MTSRKEIGVDSSATGSSSSLKLGASRKKPRRVVFGTPRLVFTSSARTTSSEPVKREALPMRDDVTSSPADPEAVHIETADREAVDPIVEVPVVVTSAEGSRSAPCEGTRSLEEKVASLEAELADLKRRNRTLEDRYEAAKAARAKSIKDHAEASKKIMRNMDISMGIDLLKISHASEVRNLKWRIQKLETIETRG
ncbi:unnamed protein product [Urochloa humidicola]